MASTPLETLRIAHSARCKLELAANRPDRNFRFILGHALTLDKVMLRVAEIELTDDDDEGSSSSDSDDEQLKGRNVGFVGLAEERGIKSQRTQRRSPPPPAPQPGENDNDDDEGFEDDEDEADGAPLERFPSASAAPPRKGAPHDDEGIGVQKKASEWSEEQLKRITEGHGNAELVETYNHVAGCRCQEHKAPVAVNVWEVPSGMDGQMGGRMAVVQVQA